MKRILSLFLAAVSAAFVLTSCSGSNSNVSDSTVTASGASDVSDGSASQEEVSSASAKVTIEGTKFMVDGKELWINGVNTPWQNWNDFCGNFDEEFWDGQFQRMSEDGINCTRIWVNCDGMNVVRLTSTGKVNNINEEHWNDLDKLFAIAAKYKVYVMPTLLSFDHFKNEKWQTFLTNYENIDSYVEEYVVEFAKRYGDNEYLFGIDLMNEPDWVYENKECGQISWEYLSYLFGKSAAAIHKNSSALVTVGLGMPKYNSDKYNGNMISDEYLKELTGDDDAYVDFYSSHFYEWERSSFGAPYTQSPEEYGLGSDKPNIIGECPNDDAEKTGMTLTEKYQSMYDNGWNGIMVWMEYRADEEQVWYCYDLTKAATSAMAEAIPEKVHPLG